MAIGAQMQMLGFWKPLFYNKQFKANNLYQTSLKLKKLSIKNEQIHIKIQFSSNSQFLAFTKSQLNLKINIFSSAYNIHLSEIIFPYAKIIR